MEQQLHAPYFVFPQPAVRGVHSKGAADLHLPKEKPSLVGKQPLEMQLVFTCTLEHHHVELQCKIMS